MGRPASGLDDCLEWQQKVQSSKDSGLSVEVFCLQEERVVADDIVGPQPRTGRLCRLVDFFGKGFFLFRPSG